MSEHLTPEHPQAEGIDPDYPDQTRQEGVHLLVNEVRDELHGEGFTDEQIFEWASAFAVREGGGSAEGLLTFIREQEHRG